MLITGRSGSGKSTVYRELRRRGLPAFDTDRVAGLARWVDAVSLKTVEVEADKPKPCRYALVLGRNGA